MEAQLNFQQHKRLGTHTAGRQPESKGQVLAFRGESFKGREIKQAVAERIAELLEQWCVGPGDVVLCGARRGAEMLFATACRERNAEVRLLMPIKQSEFVATAVRRETADWEPRFYALDDRCEVSVLLTFEQTLNLVDGTTINVTHEAASATD